MTCKSGDNGSIMKQLDAGVSPPAFVWNPYAVPIIFFVSPHIELRKPSQSVRKKKNPKGKKSLQHGK